MSAIPTLDTFAGSSNPLTTADGWEISAAEGFLETAGYARPITYTTDSAMSYGTTFNETSTSVGGIVKVTANGWVAGTEQRIYFRATANNSVTGDMYYVKVLPGSLLTSGGALNDVIEVWKIVGTNHIKIGQTQRHRQEAGGDLRHYQLQDGDSVTVAWVHDQILVKVSATDRFGDFDAVDLIHCHVTDSSIAGGNKYAGVWAIGSGSQAWNILSIQGQTFTTKWADFGSGSDAAAGTQAAPYKTFNTLLQNVDENMIGFLVGGTSTESVSVATLTTKPTNGTSWEDAPIYAVRAGETLVTSPSSTGMLELKDTATRHHEYMVFKGLTGNGANAGSSGYMLKPWSQSDANTPRFLRFQGCEGYGFKGQVFNPTVNDTSTLVEMDLHVIDCDFHGNGTTSLQHNCYLQLENTVVEYCHNYGGAGSGFKLGNGRNLRRDNLLIRFCEANGNSLAASAKDSWNPGIHIGEGSGSKAYGNRVYDNNQGIGIWGGESCIVHHNISYSNHDANYKLSGGAACGGTCNLNALYYNNSYNCLATGAGSGYGFEIAGAVTNTTMTNNVSYGEATGSFVEVTNGCGTPSGTVLTDNHEEFNPGNGFGGTGGTFGNPRWVDPANGVFSLDDSGLSPLLSTATDLSATIPDLDYNWQIRPDGAGRDKGALEKTDPDSNPPTITANASYPLTLDVAGSVVVTVVDSDGDALYMDGVFDSRTLTVSAVASGTGLLETR